MAPRAEAPRPRHLDARLRITLAAVAISGVALTLAALAFFGPTVSWSVALGAALSSGNLWALARVVSALVPHDETGAKNAASTGAWTLVALLKMFGLLGIAWLLMRHGVVAPVPMLIGFGALPIGIAIGSLVSDRARAAGDI